MIESPIKLANLGQQGVFPTGMLSAMDAFRTTPRYKAIYNHYLEEARKEGHREVVADYQAFVNSSPLRFLYQPAKERGFKNALVSDQAWRKLTDEVQYIARAKRRISQALISRGLVAPLESIGYYAYEWQKFSDTDPANVSMHLRSNINQDQGQMSLDGTPIPVIYKDFQLDERELAASRISGVAPLDLAHIAEGTEKVATAVETIMVSGNSGIVHRSRTLTGITNSPNVLTQAGADFGTASQATDSVRDAINKARTNNHDGPFVLFVPTTQYSQLETPWSTQSSEPVREVILRQHAMLEDIIHAPQLTDGTPVLVEMTRQNIEMPVAQDIIPMQYEMPMNGGLAIRILAVLSVAIKADSAGQSGIVKITGA